MKETVDAICAFIKQKVEKAGADGVAVGVSGGIDSAVVAALCAKAIGKDRVYALILPDKETTSQEELQDAREIASMFAGRASEIELADIYAAFARKIPDYAEGARIPNGNLKARIRMCVLYYYANKFGLLVAGTGDKSEIALGYFTKYGDGACDFLPIGDLYKTEVKEVARFLGIPARIIEKESSPGLWPGQTAENEIGLNYSEIDNLLRAFEAGESVEKAAERLGIRTDIAQRIKLMTENSAHKRAVPEVCKLR